MRTMWLVKFAIMTTTISQATYKVMGPKKKYARRSESNREENSTKKMMMKLIMLVIL